MDTLNDLIKKHVKSKSPPKLDCDGRSFSLGKGMFFPNNMQSMMWLEVQIQNLETEGITPRIVKPNVWKITATAYPYQLRFFYEVGYPPLEPDVILEEMLEYTDITSEYGGYNYLHIKTRKGKFGYIIRAGISENMQHALILAGGKLKYGADAISVQMFRTGERPPPPVKRTR